VIHLAVAVGPLGCNCHVLADESTGEAVVVDPGDDADEILDRVKDLKVKALLHTHCHFDHMTATRRLKEETGAEILIHRADKSLYDGLVKQYASFGAFFGVGPGGIPNPLPADGFLEDGGEVAFGRHRLQVLHTPGHTEGSCCFHLDGLLFSGDTLFRGSVGRTDLPGGDMARELDSIRTRLYTLDPGTQVFPGHGPDTRIGREKSQNSFVSD
jgi:glyoxylase-like metal-dependent hydrolase (beta-lactamase superfamily II)